MYSAAAANALGTLGAVCWSTQLIPQIILNHIRPSHTTGLQPSMMLLWAAAGVPLGVYNIVSDFNIALQIQPQILTLLSLITWSQCQYWGNGSEVDTTDGDDAQDERSTQRQRWSVGKCIVWLVGICLLLGGIEIALVSGLLKSQSRSFGRSDRQEIRRRTWPEILMAVLAATLLAAGVLRHYWDIYRHRTVRGISFAFVAIDAAGDLFSLISIFFQETIDVLGMIIYGTELVLWIGVFVCGGWFNLLPHWKRNFARWRSRHRRRSIHESDPARDSQSHVSATGGIALHTMPSSTSVFRTPSIVVQRNPNALHSSER